MREPCGTSECIEREDLAKLCKRTEEAERDVRRIALLLQCVCQKDGLPCYGDACQVCEIGKWLREAEDKYLPKEAKKA